MPVSPNGPIIIANQHPVVTAAGGVDTPGYHFNPADVRGETSPDAQWIWIPAGDAVGARFRTEINLQKVPSTLTVCITADRKYRLWINGKPAARGARRSRAGLHERFDPLVVL